jgi:ribosomal-protein-alanine acetyltransferase
MTTDLLSDFGLRAVTLGDRAVMDGYFRTLAVPLSDYTFSQLFTWRNSLRIVWGVIENHLCVFANGGADLTLLLPPIGDTGSDRALARAHEIMSHYNGARGCPERSRVEYVSEELLGRFDRANLVVTPQGNDYVYDVRRMIDLAGGDLASKRQAKNRFARNFVHRVEGYDAATHVAACKSLLEQWKERQDEAHANDESSSFIKRVKESLASELTLEHSAELGLRGLVVHVQDERGVEAIKGFTFGEALGADQSSIVVEKTDLSCKGMAQFIFSEFCRTAWADRPLVNAGDDWGLPTLAWTKSSYRPVKLLKKFVMAKTARMVVGFGAGVCAGAACEAPSGDAVVVRAARRADLDQIVALEQSCFTAYNLSRRRLQYLQARPNAVFLAAEVGGRVVGEAIALVRRHKQSMSGRTYSLAVDPACRGKGIGEKLMRAMIDELGRRGVRRIYLEVEASNSAAQRLYARIGFKVVGALRGYYGEGRDGVHMMFETAAVLQVSPLAA